MRFHLRRNDAVAIRVIGGRPASVRALPRNYYAGTSSELGPLLAVALGGIGDGHGTELYYKIAVTEWFRLTADAQFITPSREPVDSSVLLGMRGVVTL